MLTHPRLRIQLTHCDAADEPAASDGGVDHGDVVGELLKREVNV